MATAIAATIDAPSCMAPQVITSVAHAVAFAQTETASEAIVIGGSALSSITTAAVVPHCSPSAHPVLSVVELHASPSAAPVESSPASFFSVSPVAAAAHVNVPTSGVIAVAVGKSVWHVTHAVPFLTSPSVPRVPRQVAQFKVGSQSQKAKSPVVAASV